MKYLILSLPILLLIACHNNKVTENDVFSASLNTYYVTHNKSDLQKAFIELKKDIDNQKYETQYDKKDIIAVLMILKEYDVLKTFLSNQQKTDYNSKLTLNLVNYIIERKQGKSNKKFIYSNIKTIQDTLAKSSKDSLLYVDYFTMRLILEDSVENIMREIDSMQYANDNFSELYYNDILKDAIKEFYDSEITDDLITKNQYFNLKGDSEIQPATEIVEEIN